MPPSVPLAAIRQPGLLYDASGRIAAANDQAEALAGRALAGLDVAGTQAIFCMRRRDGSPLPADDLPAVRALRGDEEVGLPLDVTAADGRTLHLLSSASPLPGGGALVVWQDVTALVQAEAALRTSEERVRAIFQAMPLGMILGHADGRMVLANPAVERMLGYAADDLARMTFAEITHPDDLRTELPLVERVVAGEADGYEIEKRFLHRNGGVVRARLIANPLEFSNGAPTMAIAIIEDVTAKRSAERALADQKELLERLVETVPVMITIYEPALGSFHLNGAVEEITGWTDADAADGRLLERIYPDPAYRAEVEAYMRSLAPGFRDLTMTAKDGSTVPSSWANFRLSNDVLVGVGIDLRERARAEEDLRQSGEQFRLMGETLPYGVWRCNARGGAEYVSQSFLDLLEMTEDEMREFGWTHRLPPDEVAPMLERWLHCVETGEDWDDEHRILGPDGVYHTVLTRGRPIRDRDGAIVAWVGINLDIDDRKRSEEALRRSNEELQRFAYVASHDLQEPLRSIVSFSQLLERRYKGRLDPDADEYIAFIVQGGQRMQRLIADLLQVSRVETGARPLEPTDAGEVAAKVVRSMDAALREAGATVEVGPLPRVTADPAQLALVFQNLVGNAVKYRRPDIAPLIRITAERENGMVEVAVQDNGIGIEEEYFDRIFQMFQRLHTHDQYEGTGIGLAIVKKIVERHGGTVRVESTPGEGSTFFFTLPAA